MVDVPDDENVTFDSSKINFIEYQDDFIGPKLPLLEMLSKAKSTHKNNNLWQFDVSKITSPGNLSGTSASAVELLSETIKKHSIDAIRKSQRPSNISPRMWNSFVESEVATTTSKFNTTTKIAKRAGVVGIGIDVGFGIYDNVQAGAPAKKVVSDASVDTAFGVGGILAAMGTGALAGSIAPGPGNVAGAIGGLIGGIGYMVATELWQPDGKSVKDRAKDGVYNSIK